MPYNFSQFKEEIKKIESWLAHELSQLHTGRATPSLLDGVLVESYGSKVKLSHVSSITVEDPKTIRVSPWDKKHIKEIERAIVASNLGFGITVDEAGLRLNVPQLTTERRAQLVKIVREKLESARIKLRQAREKVWDNIQSMERSGSLSEDEKFRGKEELQKFMDEANKKLEELSVKKEKDLMN